MAEGMGRLERWRDRLFRPEIAARRRSAEALYETALAAARRPDPYRRWGVPDSLDGRFEMLALHLYVLFRRLKSAEMPELAQALYDSALRDLDRALREMGAGDLGISRRIRRMAEALNGRIAAYDAALGDPAALAETLRRNLFGTLAGAPPEESIASAADYLRRAIAGAEAWRREDLAAGRFRFPSLDGETAP